jgi:hypothetical protein
MAQKFGLEFCIVDAEVVRRLRRQRELAANPWQHFLRLIASIAPSPARRSRSAAAKMGIGHARRCR